MNKYNVLGISHIVIQPSNIKRSLEFYKESGFRIDFKVFETIKKKKLLLYDKKFLPKKTKAFFLKHKVIKMLGIELINHNVIDPSNLNNFKLQIKTPHLKKNKIKLVDPDGNIIFFKKQKKFVQTLEFFVGNYIKTKKYLLSNYQNINLKNKFFFFRSTLHKEWSINIKLKKTNKNINFFLNRLGLCCISFISNFKKELLKKNILSKITKKYKYKTKKAFVLFKRSNVFPIEEFYNLRQK